MRPVVTLCLSAALWGPAGCRPLSSCPTPQTEAQAGQQCALSWDGAGGWGEADGARLSEAACASFQHPPPPSGTPEAGRQVLGAVLGAVCGAYQQVGSHSGTAPQ